MKLSCAARLLAIFAMVGLLAGCATTRDDGDFEVTLVSVRPASGTEGEVQLACTLRLQNASPAPVTVDGAAHKIYLNGVYIGQGLTNERTEVPRLATATQQVTVTLSSFRLAWALSTVYRTQKVSYRVISTIYAAEGGNTRRIRAHKEGALDLNELAPLVGH
ncbi:MAG TPA: LEA type 2 family protein [Candidatus Limnocylindria bacterium]|jgi:LEA14-like dessication related protein|nr:LEA type 2 family protein [Candidatus Limnocylindria bacterium]